VFQQVEDGVVVKTTYTHAEAVERQLGRMDHEPEPVLVEATTEIVGVCDFCSATMPTWKYPTASFDAYEGASLRAVMITDWAACDSCHALIEMGAYDALTERCLLGFAPGLRAELHGVISDLHHRFGANRAGEAVRIS
jgi:hypothetical protein